MYAAKEAIMTIEHARAEARDHNGDGNVFCQVFFMDTRAFSKGYEEYYRRAERKYDVKYTRCRLSDVREDPETHNLSVRDAAPSEGEASVVQDEFDLVVLSVGMEISEPVKELGRRLGIQLDSYGFCHTTLFNPMETSKAGISVAGPFREPRTYPKP
jgi:heterodisulfide reductase subunit A